MGEFGGGRKGKESMHVRFVLYNKMIWIHKMKNVEEMTTGSARSGIQAMYYYSLLVWTFVYSLALTTSYLSTNGLSFPLFHLSYTHQIFPTHMPHPANISSSFTPFHPTLHFPPSSPPKRHRK